MTFFFLSSPLDSAGQQQVMPLLFDQSRIVAMSGTLERPVIIISYSSCLENRSGFRNFLRKTKEKESALGEFRWAEKRRRKEVASEKDGGDAPVAIPSQCEQEKQDAGVDSPRSMPAVITSIPLR